MITNKHTNEKRNQLARDTAFSERFQRALMGSMAVTLTGEHAPQPQEEERENWAEREARVRAECRAILGK